MVATDVLDLEVAAFRLTGAQLSVVVDGGPERDTKWFDAHSEGQFVELSDSEITC